MQEWFSHYLVSAGADIYENIQFVRPDYRKAMELLRDKTKPVLDSKPEKISVLDVACGNGVATRRVFAKEAHTRRHTIRFVGLDHDAHLLKEAQRCWPQMVTRHGDMVRTDIEEKFDIILCSFAYHHVPDSEKALLCDNLLKWCKPDGDLFLLEICLAPEQVRTYYTELKRALPERRMKKDCIRFLDWTMSTDVLSNGEWKVAMPRVKHDFERAGWLLRDSEAIWTPASLSRKSGCYFFHYTPR